MTLLKEKNTAISVRLSKDIKKEITDLAKSSHRSNSSIIQEALENYINLKKWQIEGVKKAIIQMKKNKTIEGDIFLEWMDELGNNKNI